MMIRFLMNVNNSATTLHRPQDWRGSILCQKTHLYFHYENPTFFSGGKLAGAWSWSVASIYRGEISWTNTNERHIYLIFQTPRVRILASGRDIVPEDSGGCSHFLQENSRFQASAVCFHILSTPLHVVTNHRTPCGARSILKQLLYVLTSLNCRLHCARCLFA